MNNVALIADILAIIAAIVSVYSAIRVRKDKNEITGIKAKQSTLGIGNTTKQEIRGKG